MRVRLSDVASAAGLATSTVSRALRGSPEISVETRLRVQRIARELGYQDDRKTALPDVGCILALSNRTRPPEPHQTILNGVQEFAAQHGIGVVLLDDALTREERALSQLIELASAAVVIMPKSNGPILERCRALGIPIAAASRTPAQLGPDVADVTVHADEQKVAELIVACLARWGHRKIAFAAEHKENVMMRTRTEMFRNAMAARGLAVRDEWLFSRVRSAPGELIDACRSKEGPTAIACASDSIAIELLHHLRMAGIDVPGDVSVTGVHNLHMTEFSSPPLSTVDIDLERIGYEAARQVYELAKGIGRTGVDIAFAPRLIERASVAPPRDQG